MAKVITAPGPWDEDKLTVFLSGCMVDWRSDVIEALDDLDVQVLDPTREDYSELSEDELFDQTSWESYGLEQADLRIFVFLQDEPSPTTLVEFGQFAHLPSVCVCEEDFNIFNQIEFICKRESIPLFTSLEDMIEQLRPALLEAGAVANQVNKTAMEMIAASYEDMFKQLTDLVPDSKTMAQKEISWAKTALKKTNRITWYLRWARISVAERAVDQLESAKPFPEQEAQVAKAKAIFDKWKQDATSKAGTTDWQPNQSFTALKHSLEHFFSLMSVPVQQYDPGTKSINQVLTDLEALEEEFKASTKGTLKPRPEDTKFIDFGNGWAWWSLPRAACDDESKAMGHCGNGPAAHRTDMSILSLREEKKRGKETVYEPHLTFIFHHMDDTGDGTGTLGEMKGKGNAKPVAKYHPYIIKLLEDPRILGLDGGGYMPDHNFMAADLTEEDRREIMKKNPDALLSIKERVDKYGEEYRGIGVAAEALGMEVCELGFEVARYPDWGTLANDNSDSESLRDLGNCAEGGFAFFAKYMLADVPSEYSYMFKAIAQEILAEFPDTVGLSVNSPTIQKDVVKQLDGAFTYDVDSSPLHKKLTAVFLEAYPHGDPKSLPEMLKGYIQQDWAMGYNGDGIPTELGELNGEVVEYIDFKTGLEVSKDPDPLREGTNRPYLGGPYDDDEDGVAELVASALPILQEAFQGDQPSQRHLENKGQERLFNRPATDEEAQRDGIKVSKVAAIPEPWRNSSYARSVELVPIEELKRYREYNRLNPSEAMTDDPETYIDELTEDIKQNGIREPLILEYSQNTGRALLTEGNHRLLAAERIYDLNGMVPVRGYRRYGPFRGSHKGVVPPEKNFGKDIFGKEYVPQDFKPSVIGVGGTSQGMTA